MKKRIVLTAAVISISLFASACSSSDGDSSDTTKGDDASTSVVDDSTRFEVSLLTENNAFVCDGTERPLAEIIGQPAETLTFGPDELAIPEGTTDAAGKYTLNLTCPADYGDGLLAVTIAGSETENASTVSLTAQNAAGEAPAEAPDAAETTVAVVATTAAG